jgi:hypothetical protein
MEGTTAELEDAGMLWAVAVLLCVAGVDTTLEWLTLDAVVELPETVCCAMLFDVCSKVEIALSVCAAEETLEDEVTVEEAAPPAIVLVIAVPA